MLRLTMRRASTWANVKQAPPDAILGITERFKKDASPKKINLGVGAYRDGDGKPFVLKSVREAEKRIIQDNLNKEYAPITGISDFTLAAAKFAYGEDSKVIKENRLAVTQTISGTGALRVGAEFLSSQIPKLSEIYIPNPSWANHVKIFEKAGISSVRYRYYDNKNISLDYKGLIEDITSFENNSVILFHACAHNPTGVDINKDQWSEIAKISKEKNFLIFFDMAYQGFASGNADADAYAVRYFTSQEIPLVLSQSFAKNMGLYGERVGLLSIPATSVEEKQRIESQLKTVIRPMYSNPPINGARIAGTILNDVELKKLWLQEVKQMADRIKEMRTVLSQTVEKLSGNTKKFDHIVKQIGMFAYTGLTPEQVDRLANEFSIYSTRDGRFSMAGVNRGNVEYLAHAINEVTN